MITCDCLLPHAATFSCMLTMAVALPGQHLHPGRLSSGPVARTVAGYVSGWVAAAAVCDTPVWQEPWSVAPAMWAEVRHSCRVMGLT